jgi:DNA-binding NtrC family response regulator
MSTGITYDILVIDDDQDYLHSVRRVLAKDPYQVSISTDPNQALALMAERTFDVVLLDLRMPNRDGLSVLEEIARLHPEVPVIMLTGHGNVQLAVQAIKLGAADFLEKPCPATVLRQALAHHCSLHAERSVNDAKFKTKQVFAYPDLVGESPAMQQLKALILRIAASDAPILLFGESGTGKELVARAIHLHSIRKHRPFSAIDCAAISESVLESELFGHEKGAFTGADKPSVGLIRSANTGTLFLDEIGEIPLKMQAKLLRTLQEREVRPVGSNRSIPVDLRLIAATNRDLEQEVAKGMFRSDLYFRIAAIPILLPPLRERISDIPLLAQHILHRLCHGTEKQLSIEAERLLQDYIWPGNVRELENVLHRAVALSEHAMINPDDLPATIVLTPRLAADNQPCNDSLEAYEQLALVNALRKTGNNKRQSALLLGISEATLYRKLKQFGLSK